MRQTAKWMSCIVCLAMVVYWFLNMFSYDIVDPAEGMYLDPYVRMSPIFWFLFGVSFGLAIAFWVQRKPQLPGHCENCGYDLSGNISGRCPECGVRWDSEDSGEAHKRGH